ncbi:ABCA5 [Bugula neritina]|uniref:ABCA5 n=1 Tax=Bugula neritina TaxID=10212 RepID=A0A7J7JM00_BUGNE|nr:ABCA5 [Bugula neritina]
MWCLVSYFVLLTLQVAGPVAVLATTAVSSLFFIVSFTTRYDANGTPSSVLPLPFLVFLCLSSPTALSMAIERAIYLDVAQIGLTWESLYLGDFPLIIPIVMLAFDSLFYFCLAMWLDKVVPGEYGKKQPLCYCFQPKYWSSSLRYGAQDKQVDSKHAYECVNECEHIEPIPEELKALNKLRIFGIKKTYKTSSGPVDAVRGITLDIYENEITCILGHNGAGKTTLVNMLTGLTPPTEGTAIIYGKDIRDTYDMREIRKFTGLCPQYDVLVDNMTCKEHLYLYAALKGIKKSEVDWEVQKILKDVDLIDKADCFTRNLSGGQKRKLSVGIAFIGNPKIIFLDEPSAGMDPKSRRHLWTLLKNKKNGRIILLSTHFMDEADILADRKAIVSKGKLRCCGSSLYLKTKFGIGYNLKYV